MQHTNGLRELTSQFIQTGKLEHIYLRPVKGAPCIQTDQVKAITGQGLLGDRAADYVSRQTDGSKRQVTLIQAEHLPVIEQFLKQPIDAKLLRRNLVISGINLIATKSLFKDQVMQLSIGDVVLHVTGPCEPCSKMEATFGQGAYNAIRGHGGMTARIIRGGIMKTGDSVRCEIANQTQLFGIKQTSLF